MRKHIIRFGFLAALVLAWNISPDVRNVIAQGFQIIAQNGTPAGPSINGVGDSLSGFYFGTNRVGVAGHLETGKKTSNNVPALSACGSGALAAGSTDTAGILTATGTTGCTLTFGTAFTAAPVCVITDTTNNRAGITSVTSNTALTLASLTAADVVAYVCIGQSGG
jgi:hypothetical protein